MDVPLMEAARLLSVHYKRLQRAVHDGKLVDVRPRPIPSDPHKRGIKYYVVSLEAARAYCEAQGWLVEYVPPNETSAMLLRLVQENERLQQELAAARATSARVSSATWLQSAVRDEPIHKEPSYPENPLPVIPQSPPPRRDQGTLRRWADYERITDCPDLPPDGALIGLALLARAHGVAISTAMKQPEKHFFAIEAQRYKIGRNTDVSVVNPENTWKALQMWWRRGQMRQELAANCGLNNCPCLHLLTDLAGQFGSEIPQNLVARYARRSTRRGDMAPTTEPEEEVHQEA